MVEVWVWLLRFCELSFSTLVVDVGEFQVVGVNLSCAELSIVCNLENLGFATTCLCLKQMVV